jgi:hypothetical protein
MRQCCRDKLQWHDCSHEWSGMSQTLKVDRLEVAPKESFGSLELTPLGWLVAQSSGDGCLLL